MMRHAKTIASALGAVAAVAWMGTASAQTPVHGVWIDDTGRGGIEIKDCEGKLCGHLVWLKETTNSKACGTQIIGNIEPVGEGVWGRGWIYSPEKQSRFDVELTQVAQDELQVTGFLGTKLFSKTMIWKRAPADIARCDTPTQATAPKKADTAAVQNAEAPAEASPAPAERETGQDRGNAQGNSVASKSEGSPSAAPTQRAAKRDTPRASADRPVRTAARKERCTIDVPYVTISFPCDDD